MIQFKFFKGRVYSDEYTLPTARRMSGRRLTQDLIPIQRTIWRTASGLTYVIERMSIDHIVNVMRCLTGNGNMEIPEPYEGRTRIEWYEIFHNEILRRRETR